jgi:hypothetical protein
VAAPRAGTMSLAFNTPRRHGPSIAPSQLQRRRDRDDSAAVRNRYPA